MYKIVYFVLLFYTYTAIHVAVLDNPTHILKFKTVAAQSTLGTFLSKPDLFEFCITNPIFSEKTRKERCTVFAKQLKSRSKEDRLKALLWACHNDLPIAAKIIITSGAPVNECMPHSFITPISIALNKNFTLLKILLENGADANKIFDENTKQTPLYLAVRSGDSKKVELLLQNNADPNISQINGVSPLHYACEKGYIEIIKLLLTYGANPNLINAQGATPFFIAAQNGRTWTAQILLQAGAHINQSNFEKTTPLQAAVVGGYFDTVCFLLSCNANPSLPDNEGLTPLHDAISARHHTIIKVLLEYGTNKHAMTRYAESPLLIAAGLNIQEAVYALLHVKQKYGVHSSIESDEKYTSLDQPNISGYTPLFAAAHNGNLSIFNMLIKAGASIQILTTRKNTNFQSIISTLANTPYNIKGILALCKKYIDAKLCRRLADVKDKRGNYPMHKVCAKGETIHEENKLDFLQFLLDSNVSTQVRNAEGKTPYHIACETNNKEAAYALMQHFVRSTIQIDVV